jgi:GT2 family glycosyltransferase
MRAALQDLRTTPFVSSLPAQRPAKHEPTLSVSVVSYQPHLAHLESMLASLGRALDAAHAAGQLTDAVVALVDNGPGHTWRPKLDERLTRLAAGRSWLAAELIAPPANVGYGRGHNLAIVRSSARYHLVLNPDVTLDERAIVAAVQFMESHPQTGLLAPFVSGLSGQPEYLCKRYPTVFDLWLRGFAPAGLRRALRPRLDRYEMRDVIGDADVSSVPMVSGCFMFVRRALLQQIGGFSPKYFMYFEDYDLSLRLGHHAHLSYVPGVRVVHAGGRAARKGVRHVRMFMVSALKFFQTHGWKWW